MFIVMHRLNGTYDFKFIYHIGNKFVYEEGVYLIDQDFMTWSDSLGAYTSFYEQGLSLPIRYEVDKKAFMSSVEDALYGTRVEANVDAGVLYSTVKSEVIQKLMRGEEFEEWMRRTGTWVLVGTHW